MSVDNSWQGAAKWQNPRSPAENRSVYDSKRASTGGAACGQSQSQPFCDGSHQGTAFTPLKIVVEAAKDVSLCACKRTGTSPYCDGAHKKLA